MNWMPVYDEPEEKIVPAPQEDHVPDGWRKTNAYEVFRKGDELVITGDVADCSDRPDFDEEKDHNCDYMGCSSVSHVIFRAKIVSDGEGIVD